ncbi:imidazolonepropionase-like domain-containing protein [Mesorhizobium norvegicum]|uniref:imidazolonepropionase-like domain-containing protein n=1 Tax=Mesorhizobium norvegicum TaxID=1085774 RepID=UPI003CCC7266
MFDAIPNGKPLHTFPGIALFSSCPHIEIRYRIDDGRIAAVGPRADLRADLLSQLVAAVHRVGDGARSQRVADTIDAADAGTAKRLRPLRQGLEQLAARQPQPDDQHRAAGHVDLLAGEQMRQRRRLAIEGF